MSFCEACGAVAPAGAPCPRCGCAGPGVPRGAAVRLGRAPDNDLTIDAPGVSRYHAELRRDPPGQWTLVDLDSRGGTFLDGRKVRQAALAPGQGIVLGETPVPADVLRALLAAKEREAASAPTRRAPDGPAAPPVPAESAGGPSAPAEGGRPPRRATLWTRVTSVGGPAGIYTLGVFSIVLGVVGLLVPALVWTLWRFDAAHGRGRPLLLAIASALVVHQLVLFLGGLGLLLRRRWGRILSLIWAGVSWMALLAAGVAAALDLGISVAGGLGLAALIVGCIVLAAYPTLLVLLLNLPAYRHATDRPGFRGDARGSEDGSNRAADRRAVAGPPERTTRRRRRRGARLSAAVAPRSPRGVIR